MGLSPLLPNRNELGDPLGRVNELGAALPPLPDSPLGLQPLISQRGQRESQLEQQLAPKAAGTGFWDRVRHVAATIGNVAGDIVAPGTMALIPGTQLGNEVQHNQRSRELAGLQSADRTDATATSEDTLRGAQTTEATTRAAKDQQEIDAPPAEPSLAQAYAHAVQSVIKAGSDPDSDPVVQHVRDAITALTKQPNAEQPKTTDIKGPDGQIHTMGYDPATKKYSTDEGISGFKPPVTNNNAADNHLFAEQERGRGLLDAAEKQYRTAQQGANTMRDMLASADAGNKMSGQMLPLEGALAITTAQGVHRINRTEVDQFAGGGSLYDKIAGEMGKLTAGQPMDAELRSDVKKLTDMQEAAAYANYKDAHASATRRYKLEGEEPLPPPGAGSAPAGADNEVYVGGKLVGHTVGGRYVALGGK